jgi:hypothetical protein
VTENFENKVNRTIDQINKITASLTSETDADDENAKKE